ncbi:uncharacterized protein EHS24_005204 [Apiotrichum porosum]|uniref:Uncharacterized protein n=1 Tax=Apiotrichum porosum TaxID=105984 RepID=A0A427XDJ7_9TREE|nr:uncharacterized protein EHS24_005204 [Apiotrichum porosum]RSH76807.1 hypothetical protein EHS24_005204 [Apiotrichum porosum]
MLSPQYSQTLSLERTFAASGTGVKTRSKERFDHIFDQLNLREKTALLENSSRIGRAWLATLPLYPSLRSTDTNVTVGLLYRTLIFGHGPPCQFGHSGHGGSK